MQESVADMPSSSEIKSGQFDDMFMNGIAGINPSDIESITILRMLPLQLFMALVQQEVLLW